MRAEWRWHDGRRRHDGLRRRQGGVLREDRALEFAQPLAGLDPELPDEDPAGVLIGLQRLGLPVAAVQSEHELRPEALPVRVLVDEGLELNHHLGVPRQSQLRVDQLLDGRHSQIVQPVDFVPGEGLIGQVAQRTAAPEERRIESADFGGDSTVEATDTRNRIVSHII